MLSLWSSDDCDLDSCLAKFDGNGGEVAKGDPIGDDVPSDVDDICRVILNKQNKI